MNYYLGERHNIRYYNVLKTINPGSAKRIAASMNVDQPAEKHPVDRSSTILDAVIAGGGLAGLAIGVGFSSLGLKYKIVERASELKTGTSTVIGLGQNAFYALDQIDKTGFITNELRSD